MEFSDLFLILLSLFTFLFALKNFILISPFSKCTPSTTRLPPGPWKLPIIGSLHHLNTGTLPHHSLRSLSKKHGSLMHLQLGQISVVVVSAPEPAFEILKTHDKNFAQRPKMLSFDVVVYGACDISLSPIGQYWRSLKKICVTELLAAKRIESFHFVREEEAMSMIESMSKSCEGGLPVNLSQKVYSLAADVVSRVAFGAKCKEKERFVDCIREFVLMSNGFNVSDLFPSYKLLSLVTGFKYKLEKLHQRVDKIISGIIEEHKQKSILASMQDDDQRDQLDDQEDLVDVLLKIQKNSDLDVPITMDSVKAIIMDMFTGGTDTSSTVIEWTMSELMRHPPIMAKVQEEARRVFRGKGAVDETGINELKYLKLVLMETLRLHPPVCLLIRECIESCKIGGYDIPSKTKVLINSWAMSRDPTLWGDDCEVFNPERFLGSSIDYKGAYLQYLPFGSGRRMCPGILFGMVNVELPLAKLLYYFDWKLPNDMKPQDLDMAEVRGGTTRRKSELVLIPVPRFPINLGVSQM